MLPTISLTVSCIGCSRLPDEHCQPSVYQGYLAYYPYDFFRSPRCRCVALGNVAVPRHNYYVGPAATIICRCPNNGFHSGRASSIGIILFGSLYYTWVKHQESQPAISKEYDRVPMDDVEAGLRKENPKPE